MDYLFVYKGKGWWLKIKTIEQLIDYHEKTNTKWYKAFENLANSKEFTKNGTEHASAIAFAIGLFCENNDEPILTGTAKFAAKIFSAQMNCIMKNQSIYINPKGGWHPDFEKDIPSTEYCRRQQLIFPTFKESDIRIKQFPGGTHWYAYIDDIQLTNHQQVKWDNYQDAYEYAHMIYETSQHK